MLQTGGTFRGKPYPIKSIFITHGNVANTLPNSNEWLNVVVPSLDLIVVADMVFSDTARYADIVLPVADWFENVDVVGGTPNLHVQYNEKAIEPLYESKPDSDIVRLLADKMGVGEYFTKSDEEYLAEMFTSPFSESHGVSFEMVKERRSLSAT